MTEKVIPSSQNAIHLGQQKMPLLNVGLCSEKRTEIKHYFQNTFTLYEQLYKVLRSPAAYYVQADPLRHPLIFYYGHTAVFFINKLLLANIINARLDQELESMLAIGVDEMSWDDVNSAHYDWPTVDRVANYRQQVFNLVTELIERLDFTMPIDWESPMWPILMGIEHERIHLETSSVLIRQLPLQYIQADHGWPICESSGTAPANSLIFIPGKKINLGRCKQHRLYGWDNEYDEHSEEVPPFKVSQYLVSNQEFYAFLQDKGYQTQKYWTNEGWQWVQDTATQHPKFWVKQPEGVFTLRCMLAEIAMPWNWPVEVNYYEAKAYCQYLAEKTKAKIRLPTEAEWVLLRDQIDEDQPDWECAPGNLNLEYFASPCPVNQFKTGELYDIVGNVWQWTETAISSFPGFAPHPLYDDFSTPTFDGKHFLFKGGSWISTGNEATRDARFAFRKHFFQHAGFRYVSSAHPAPESKALYETDDIVAQYIHFHYSNNQYFDVANFPSECVKTVLAKLTDCQYHKMLDLGCAVGRSAFEFSRYFEFVEAVDFSARFIKVATQLQDLGQVHYEIREEGDIKSYGKVTLAELDLDQKGNNIKFSQADACNLPQRLQDYDLIFAANLLDRLYDPLLFLNQIHKRLRQNGYLVLTSPYTWLEEYTVKSKWLGGYRGGDGELVTTLRALQEHLTATFEFISPPIDIPFVIRETKRKYQHSLAEMTIWRKKQ